MTVEALLAKGETGAEKIAPMDLQCVVWLENRIDAMQATLPAIDKFTIPGGHEAVSLCHVLPDSVSAVRACGIACRPKIRIRCCGIGLSESSFRLFLCARTVVNGALWGRKKRFGFRNVQLVNGVSLPRGDSAIFSLFFSFFIHLHSDL